MSGLESKLTEAEELVRRNVEGDEFVERELQPVIEHIFDKASESPTELAGRTEALFTRIVAMAKSTGAFNLYGRLSKNPFPFTESVLKHAVENEPYYNNNDSALVAYVSVSCQNGAVPDEYVKGLFESLPNGHSFSYVGVLEKTSEARPNERQEIPVALRELLVYAITRDQFEQTRAKALCAIVYFGLEEAVPRLVESLKAKIDTLDQEEVPDMNKMHEIGIFAKGLYYLTSGSTYAEIADLVIPEHKKQLKCLWSREDYTLPSSFVGRVKSLINDDL